MEKVENRYLSARKFAREYPIYSERTLRKMIEAGKIPGIQTQKGFKISTMRFLEMIDAWSMNNAATVADAPGVMKSGS